MKPRLCIYLSDKVARQLTAAVRRSGATMSAITETALAAFLDHAPDAGRDAAMVRRLGHVSRQLHRIERDQTIVAETLALFIRYYLAITPPLPAVEQEAARALGAERFAYFVNRLGRRLAAGKLLIRDTLEEAARAEEELLAEDGADALGAVAEDEGQRVEVPADA